jgi:ParB family chromosome partitioning protein
MDKQAKWPTIELNKVSVSNANVRTLNRTEGIDELAESIRKYGLLQPVVVYEGAPGTFDLVVGQRRFLAFKQLAKRYDSYKQIPAMVIPKADKEKLRIMSLSENIHRVQLNRGDIVEVISFLYVKYSKSAKKVARLLGVSVPTVYNYLKVKDAPDEIKRMYVDKQIGRDDVRRLMEMAPDKTKMVQIAEEMIKEKLTGPQKERLPEIHRRNPSISPRELIREAKTRTYKEKIIVPLSWELIQALDTAVKEVGLLREEIARKALEEWLSEKGYYKRP